MQNDIAILMLTGKLFKDPEMVERENAQPRLDCLLEVRKSKFIEETKEWEEGGDHDVIKFSCFGHLANSVKKYCSEGMRLTVAGKPTGRMTYHEKYGEGNFTTLTATKVIFDKPGEAPSADETATDKQYEADQAAAESAAEQEQIDMDDIPM